MLYIEIRGKKIVIIDIGFAYRNLNYFLIIDIGFAYRNLNNFLIIDIGFAYPNLNYFSPSWDGGQIQGTYARYEKSIGCVLWTTHPSVHQMCMHFLHSDFLTAGYNKTHTHTHTHTIIKRFSHLSLMAGLASAGRTAII
jgi:hypothetical protein